MLKYKLIDVLTFLCLFPLLISCGINERHENHKLKKEIQQLKLESQEKDSAIGQFFGILNEIENNLSVIKQKQQVISKSATEQNEIRKSVRDQIDEDIQTINFLMDLSREKIASFSSQLQRSTLKISSLEQLIKQLNEKLDKKDQEINELKQQLIKLNFSIETLNARIDTLVDEKIKLNLKLAEQEDELNTAWYAIGTRKELVDNKVIDRTGGLLGIGKSSKLKPEFNRNYFIKVNIQSCFKINLYVKKAKLITPHPEKSYQLVRDANNRISYLTITNPEEFWSASKFLVIEVE